MYRQVAFVTNKHDRHVWVRMLPGIFKPACKVVESLSPAVMLCILFAMFVMCRLLNMRDMSTCLVMS